MSLLKSASSGVKWTLASGITANSIQLLQIAILANILAPEDFGVVAMLMTFILLAMLVSDLGISNAIIHKQDISIDGLSSLYWLQIFSGLIVYVSFILLSPWIVGFYNEPILFEIIDYAALLFLIIPIGSQFKILLQKKLQFQLIAIVEVFSSVAGFVVALSMAMMDQGAISIIWGLLMKGFLSSSALFFIGWRSGWLPLIRFRFGDVREYIGFSSYQLGEKIVTYINERSPHIIIGYFFGAEVLGYYHLAFNYSVIPFQVISMVFSRVSFSVYAKVQDNNAKLRRGYLFILSLLSMVNLPMLMGLIIVAPVFVVLLFGGQWQDAVFPLQLLCVVSILQYISNTTNPILLAKGRVDLAFKWNLSMVMVQIPLLTIGAFLYGMVGVVMSILISQLIFLSLNYLLLIRKLIDLEFAEYLMSIVPFFFMSLAMVILIVPVNYLLKDYQIEGFFLQIFLGALVYVFMITIFKRSFFNEVIRIFLNRI